MAIGSRGDIEIFVSIATRLQGYRIRIATCPAHQAIVLGYAFEFYDIGSGQDQLARVLGHGANALFLDRQRHAQELIGEAFLLL